jgi:hypothetical protein
MLPPMDDPQHRTLLRALKVMGTEERLAAKLKVSPAELAAYFGKAKTLPQRIYLRALDIVSGGRHT